MNSTFNDKTPLVMLTVGDLRDIISTPVKVSSEKRYVFGLRGICNLLGVGTNKAIEIKNTIIKDAVRQHGRKIIVDAEKALELYAQTNK